MGKIIIPLLLLSIAFLLFLSYNYSPEKCECIPMTASDIETEIKEDNGLSIVNKIKVNFEKNEKLGISIDDSIKADLFNITKVVKEKSIGTDEFSTIYNSLGQLICSKEKQCRCLDDISKEQKKEACEEWVKLESEVINRLKQAYDKKLGKISPRDSIDQIEEISPTKDQVSDEQDKPKKKILKPISEPNSDKPIIIGGTVLDKNNKGIPNVNIEEKNGVPTKSDEFGFFNLTLKHKKKEYGSKVTLYYSKDTLRKSSREGFQENIVLRFD